MQASELKEKPTSELEQREQSLQAELFNLKFQLATEQLTNTAKLRNTKRDLARVKTVLRERALGVQQTPAVESSSAQDEEA